MKLLYYYFLWKRNVGKARWGKIQSRNLSLPAPGSPTSTWLGADMVHSFSKSQLPHLQMEPISSAPQSRILRTKGGSVGKDALKKLTCFLKAKVSNVQY